MDASRDPAAALPPRWPGFARYAWGVLVYTLFVVLFGAWVRITGSGAGCGDNWPSCHGELIPRAPAMQTVIEYTHRLTSGILGPAVLVLLVWAYRGAGRRRPVRLCASLTVFLVVVEALIGAGLVLKELVADDDSVSRAVVVGLHLGNTLLLTACAALTAWFGYGRTWPGLRYRFPWRGALRVALVGVVLVSMTGAVTALGDTLFPIRPTTDSGWLAHVRDDLSSGAHFLVRLRIVHPLLAVVVGVGLLWLAGRFEAQRWQGARAGGPPTRLGSPAFLAGGLQVLVWSQLLLGTLNIALGAPGWLQLLHLLLAQGVWIGLVLLYVAQARISAELGVG